MKRFDTQNVDYSDRDDYWREAISQIFVPLQCEFEAHDRSGTLSSRALSKLNIAKVTCCPQKVMRTQGTLDHHDTDSILMSFIRQGQTAIHQGYKHTLLKQGEFGLYDTQRPYDLHMFGASEQIVVQLPRQLIHERLGNLDQITASSFGLNHPLGTFAHNFLDNLLALPDELPEKYMDTLSSQAISLILGIISDESRTQSYRPDTKQGLLTQIQYYLQQEYSDPELSNNQVAKKFGISTRYLSMLFQLQNTTFGRFLLEQRLDACASALSNPNNLTKQVSEIAWNAGFTDMSYFSREFKKQYDMAPRQFRQERSI